MRLQNFGDVANGEGFITTRLHFHALAQQVFDVFFGHFHALAFFDLDADRTNAFQFASVAALNAVAVGGDGHHNDIVLVLPQ